MNNFVTSEKGLLLIQHYESLHDNPKEVGLQPIMDPVGIWTDGWGHALRNKLGSFIKGLSNKKLAYETSKVHTKEDALLQLKADLKSRERAVNSIQLALNQNMFDALVSFTYNLGEDTLGKLVNRLKYAKTAADVDNMIGLYSYAGGKRLNGLIKRRLTESTLYNTGELKFF